MIPSHTPLIHLRIVYYNRSDENETRFARELHERIRREFPEVSICPTIDLCVKTSPLIATTA